MKKEKLRPKDKMRIEPKPPIGRPMKYDNVLLSLDDNDLYTPAAIVRHALQNGMIEDEKTAITRLRITLSRYSQNHEFPKAGDGLVTIKGQAPTPGWWGHRWKDSLLP